MTSKSIIAGTGYYVPEKRVTSCELEQGLSLSEGWIEKRTGVRERRFAGDDEAVTDLAYRAAAAAMKEAQIDGADIGLVLLATSTPDHLLPPSAPLLAHRLGSHGGAMDLAGACTGFVYALTLADSFVRTHGTNAIVVGANVLSRRINLKDKASSILFGDAAGAVVLKPTNDPAPGLLGTYLSSQGQHYDLIKIPAGGSRQPFSPATPEEECAIQLSDGGAAFATAIESMASTALAALQSAALTPDDIDWWFPHQANRRIIEAAAKKICIRPERIGFTITEFGNSSAGTVPLTLAKYRESGRLKRGNKILMTGVGAGFTEGSIVWQF